MDILIDSLLLAWNFALTGYLVWRAKRTPPDLRELVRQTLYDKLAAKGVTSGRELLRARLAAKMAEKSDGEDR